MACSAEVWDPEVCENATGHGRECHQGIRLTGEWPLVSHIHCTLANVLSPH